MIFHSFIATWSISLYLILSEITKVHGLVHPTQQVFLESTSPVRKVPVILGVMSQCPDALYCEDVFDKVLEHVGDIVDLQLSFIGRVNATEPIYGVTCLHGPAECTGNIHELCVGSVYPPREQWWPFVTCSNAHGRFGVGTQEVSKHCAHSGGLSWKEISKCATSGEGEVLLKESVALTEMLGIQRSCTIVINGRKRCVRDDEQWKECKGGHSVEDFVQTIQEEYKLIST